MLSAIYSEVRHDSKLLLTLALTILGSIFLMVFGLVSFAAERYLLAGYLLIPLGIAFLNLALLKTSKKSLASINLAFIAGGISLMLIAHGGNENTGMLWTYTLVTVAIAVLNFRQGIIFSCLYLLCAAAILYFPMDAAFATSYGSVESSRYMFSCCALCAIALTLVNIQENMTTMLHKKTITDELTGLYNRAVIRSELDSQVSKYGNLTTATLIMIDIDYFKNINDDFGHAVGDKVLVDVAHILQSCLRTNDLAIRWGGEEFLLVLPECTKQHGINKANQINEALSDNAEVRAALDRPVTLSMGISELTAEDELYEAIKRADLNLYKAKTSGRNTIVSDELNLGL